MKRTSAITVGLVAGLMYGIVRHPGALVVLLLIVALFGAAVVYAAYSWLAGYIGPGGVAALLIGFTLRRLFFDARKRGQRHAPGQAPPK